MTGDQLMAGLSQVRLPAGMAGLSGAEMLALLGLGGMAGLAVALVLWPLTRSRPPRRAQRLSDLGHLPVPERMLALARMLGHLPAALRPGAYGAAAPPSDRKILRIARRARWWRR